MRTGSTIVDAMANVNITGNIISPIWYRTVVKEDGKPHFLAIAVLSDIVYWYRPRVIRDETTGNVVKAVKRFSDDLLQRSSKALAEQFGVSKRQITEALKVLEQIKVISRRFRTIERKYGDEVVKIANVQYIELHVDVLLKLSEIPDPDTENYPAYSDLPEGETQNNLTSGTKLPDPPTQNCGTNTEITTKTTTEITAENKESVRAREEATQPSSKNQKIQYADDVSLTVDEYNALVEKLGSKEAADECIEILSNYKGANGKRYKSDYKAILNWVIDKYRERHKTAQRGQPAAQNDPLKAAAAVKAMLEARRKYNANGYGS